MFDAVKGLLREDVLYLAGIGGGSFRTDTQLLQHLAYQRVAFIYFMGDLQTGSCQGQKTILIHLDVPPGLQEPNGTADTGLGIIQIFRHIHAAYRGASLG